MQLAFYTRSEHRLGESQIPIEADYALDGLYVTNWRDLFGNNSDNNNHISLLIKPSFGITDFINESFYQMQLSN